MVDSGMSNWDHLGEQFFVGMDPGTIDPPEQPVRIFTHRQNTASAGWIPSMLDGWHPGLMHNTVNTSNNRTVSEEEREEMTWTNPEARDIAREILSEKKKGALREEVEAAVSHLQEMIAGATCGSVFTFRKTGDNGKHYWYAAIKNGDRWYTTAQNPRQLDDDNAFIEWLITLEAWKSEGLELTAGSIPERQMLEATATES